MGGWLIPRQDEAWFQVTSGEPSEVELWCRNETYLSTAAFASQTDAETFLRWCLVDRREPSRTMRRSPPEWPRQPREWTVPKTATWEIFVERGTPKGHWWWLLLVADDQPTALTRAFNSRDQAVGFLAWMREDGPKLDVEEVEPVEMYFEEKQSWFTEMEEDIARRHRQENRRVDFDEALAKIERPRRSRLDLYELMRRHKANDDDDFAGGRGA